MISSYVMINRGQGGGEEITKRCMKIREWMDMFIILTVVVMSQGYTYVNTYAIPYFNFEQFTVHQLYCNKKNLKNIKTKYRNHQS